MIILLTGNDTFTLSAKLKEIRQKFVREVDASNLNSSIVNSDEMEPGVLRREMMASPFLAKRRMVILKECGDAITKNENLLKEWKELSASVSGKAQDLPIVVIIESSSIAGQSTSRKKSTTKPTKAKTSLIDLLPPDTLRIESWIRSQDDIVKFAVDQGRGYGIQFDRSALGYLAQLPADPWAVGNLVATLAHWTNTPSTPISADDMERWSTLAVDDTLFSLQDAFGNRNRGLFLKELITKLHAGVHPLVVLAALQKTIGLLMGSLTDSLPPGTHPFVAQKIRTQSRLWNRSKIKTIARLLFLSDGLMKSSSGLTSELILTRLAFSL